MPRRSECLVVAVLLFASCTLLDEGGFFTRKPVRWCPHFAPHTALVTVEPALVDTAAPEPELPLAPSAAASSSAFFAGPRPHRSRVLNYKRESLRHKQTALQPATCSRAGSGCDCLPSLWPPLRSCPPWPPTQPLTPDHNREELS